MSAGVFSSDSAIMSVILILIIALVSSVDGNKNNTTINHCAAYKDPCSPTSSQPCCNRNYRCKAMGLDSFVCAERVELGKSCEIDNDCDVKWHAKCSKDNECVCQPNTIVLDNAACGPIVGEPCWENELCATENSDCIDNVCRCKQNYLKQSNNQCLPMLLGEPCDDDTICKKIRFASCTNKKVCGCILNTIELNPSKCAPLLNGYCWADNECVLINSYCDDNKCKCKPNFVSRSNIECVSGYINMTCNTNIQCSLGIKYSKCFENKCICESNYGSVNGTQCGAFYNMKCLHNEPCATPNAVCINNKCQCSPKYTYRADKCVPTHLKKPCEYDEDCNEIKNAKCSIDKKCVCKEGNKQLNINLCGSKLGEFCSTNNECIINDSVCVNNQCQCKPNYVSKSTDQCIAAFLGRECSEDEDCIEVIYAECSKNNQCICKSNFGQINQTACAPLLGKYCWNDNLCGSENTTCIDHICRCKPNFIEFNNECILNYLGSLCKIDEDCATILHAKCSKDKKCTCRSNNVELNKTICAPLLNEFCWTNEKCAPDNSYCINNSCQCKNHYLHRSNNECLPVYLEQFCRSNEDCKEIKYSECSENNKCICKSNYIAEFDHKTCKALLNEYCENVIDCSLFNSVCIDHKCECLESFSSRTNKECSIRYLQTSCIENSDCDAALYATCSIHGKCICNENYVLFNDTICAPLLYEYCQDDESCATTNAVCISNRCQCESYYVSQYNNYCKPTRLDIPCMDDIDCDGIKHSRCSMDKICVCENNYARINERKCAPLLGGYCSADKHCITDNANCVDNQCQCKLDFVSISNKQCILEFVEKYCRTNDDCEEISNAECTTANKCMCKPHHFAITRTICTPFLGRSCLDDEDCNNNTVCNVNKCKCKHNYVPKSNYECIPLFMGGKCNENEDCIKIMNAICSPSEICICDNNNIAISENKCSPIIGGSCSNDNPCYSETMVCVKNKCQCKVGFSSVSDSQCVAAHLLYGCFEDEDCSDPWHAKCSKDHKCVCRFNNIEVHRLTCLPLLNGKCWKDDQCMVSSSFCIDYYCKCKYNFTPVSNNLCLLME